MLEQTGLARARRASRVGRLSGGNRQRVNVAHRADRRPAGARARRALGVARPAPARAPVGVHRGARCRRARRCVFSTHNVGEAQRHADRVLVLDDGRAACSTAAPRSCCGRAASRADGRPRAGAGALPGARRRGRMRWLLRKDLLILRPLAAAARAPDRLSGRDRAADRPCDLARPVAAARGDRRRDPAGRDDPPRRAEARQSTGTPTSCSQPDRHGERASRAARTPSPKSSRATCSRRS